MKEKEKIFILIEKHFKHDLSVSYIIQRLFLVENKIDIVEFYMREEKTKKTRSLDTLRPSWTFLKMNEKIYKVR